MRFSKLGILAWLLIAFLYLPVVVVLAFAFQGSSRLALPLTGPSLRWFQFVLSDDAFRSALSASFKVGLAASVFTMLIGTLTGLAFTRYKLKLEKPLEALAMAPIALPGLFIGLALLAYFGRLGLSLSLVTVFLAHLLYVLPYVLIVMRSRLDRFDVALEEAARDLGANTWQTFWKVTFPLIWPTIVAGGVLAFALSFDEFLITLFVIGSDSTLPIMMWSRMRRRIDPSINAVATIIFVVFVTSLALAAVMWLRRSPAPLALGDEDESITGSEGWTGV
ncbi:MAG TPA: ABC transporter permease [Anaerolineae bacterium]|nr:ABC transporter permease [Anaerolineae bacterium]